MASLCSPPMRLDRFDLNLLVTLDVLLETRNVTRASALLHIAQSSCSSALGRLREHFGDELLVPMGRQLVTTPLAESLRAPVREALRQARGVIARQQAFEPATAQETFDVCGSDYVVSVLFAPLAQRLVSQAPGLKLQVRSAPGDVFTAFERGDLHMLVVPSGLPSSAKHCRQALFSDTLVGVVSADNRQVPTDSVEPAQLEALAHVAVRLGTEGSLTLEALQFPEDHPHWQVACTVDRFHLAPLFVVGTSRLTFLPRLLALHFALQYPLRLVELPHTMAARFEMELLWPRHMHDSPAHRWLRGRLIEQACTLACPGPAGPSGPCE